MMNAKLMLSCASVLSVGVLTLVSTDAWAGKESHGGVVVACAFDQRPVRLLDLEEGRASLPGSAFLTDIGGDLVIPETNTASVAAQFRAAADRLRFDEQLYLDFVESYSIITKDVRYIDLWSISSGNFGALPPIDGKLFIRDVYGIEGSVILLRHGCELQQVAIYTDHSSLLINKKLFDQLTNTGKSALYYHEAMFHLTREYLGVTDSRPARRLTALAFDQSLGEAEYQKEVRAILSRN